MPIDEMLIELRFVLEAFETKPCHARFEQVQAELHRIMSLCEDMLPED